MPRWVDCKRATFKYGLGDEFINILKVLHTLGLDSTEKVRVKGVEVSPRDVVAAVLPDPATVGPRMKGKTCAGLWVTGKGKDGEADGRSTYLYHVVDNEWTMQEYGHQCVVWQTAINPVVALELLATGTWNGAGVLGSRGLRRRAVPRPAHRLRLPVGPDGGGRLGLGTPGRCGLHPWGVCRPHWLGTVTPRKPSFRDRIVMELAAGRR